MKYWIPLSLLFVLSLPIQYLKAHPVSFRGSLGIMGQHSPILAHNQINNSFRHWFAVGAHHFVQPEYLDRNASFLSANFLLKRWNTSSLQANIYGVVGVGENRFLPTKPRPSGLALLQFDIEGREYYFLAKHTQFIDDKGSPEFSSIHSTSWDFALLGKIRRIAFLAYLRVAKRPIDKGR